MSKDKSINCSSDSLKNFETAFAAMAAMSGVDKCESAMHYFRLGMEDLKRFLFNMAHPQSLDRKLNIEKDRFFAIFKGKYLELTDIEYPTNDSPIEAKMIKQLNESLLEKNFTCDEFLSWFFDVFLVAEPKFKPPHIKLACSLWVVSKFFFENKDVMKQKQEHALRQKQVIDLINRARVLIRQSKTKEEAEEIKNFIKKYQVDGIMSMLREKVELFEDRYKVIESQENNQVSSGTGG